MSRTIMDTGKDGWTQAWRKMDNDDDRAQQFCATGYIKQHDSSVRRDTSSGAGVDVDSSVRRDTSSGAGVDASETRCVWA